MVDYSDLSTSGKPRDMRLNVFAWGLGAKDSISATHRGHDRSQEATISMTSTLIRCDWVTRKAEICLLKPQQKSR
jgi:hypothetical protein